MKNNKKNGNAIKLATVVLIFVLIIVSSSIWLPLPATFLLAKDNVQKADCIVPLGGDLYYRFKKAIELYNKGYAKNIVVSVVPERVRESPEYCSIKLKIYGIQEVSEREFALMAFKYLGKDAQNIYITDDEVTSTYEEALATKKFMLKKGFKSLIVITSNYHTRRAISIFKWVFKGSGIKIYNCNAGSENLSPYCWWQKEGDVRLIIQEYTAFIHNAFYHFMLKKDKSPFVA